MKVKYEPSNTNILQPYTRYKRTMKYIKAKVNFITLTYFVSVVRKLLRVYIYSSHQKTCPISQPKHTSIIMPLLTMNMQFSPILKLGYGQYVSIDEEIQFVVHS